ncbi:MAG: hypothetical protein H8E64_05855 [Candidatus Marinimicrobia bacterium]|nr:hypothetical protein [Candidatus Neomarinimicrobiota bacterium]
MKHITRIITIILLSATVSAQSFVGDTFEKGAINYSDRTISAVGIGFIPENVINAGQARRSALRIAKQDALRNLIEIVNGVVVNSETTISGAMFDDVIRSQVKGAIRGAYQVGEPTYLSDTSLEVTYEVKMSGISEILIAPATVNISEGASTVPQSSTVASTTTSSITGIILDATGLGCRPAMSPKILDQSENVLYGPGDYSREYAVMNGVVGYSKSLESAAADQRVKGNPLVIKAVAVSGTNKTDVIVGNKDVSALRSAESSYGVLKDCRVIVVLD